MPGQPGVRRKPCRHRSSDIAAIAAMSGPLVCRQPTDPNRLRISPIAIRHTCGSRPGCATANLDHRTGDMPVTVPVKLGIVFYSATGTITELASTIADEAEQVGDDARPR